VKGVPDLFMLGAAITSLKTGLGAVDKHLEKNFTGTSIHG
jgi:hypothetical protein